MKFFHLSGKHTGELLLSPIEHEATAFFGLDYLTFLSLFDVQASVLKTQAILSHFPLYENFIHSIF